MNKIISFFFIAILVSLFVGCGEKKQNAASTGETASAVTATQAAPTNSQDLYEQGRNYHSGLNGTPVDKAKAYELFSKSADMGNAGAMFFLGVMNEMGESVPVNEQKALELYEKSEAAGCGCAPPAVKALKAKMAKAKKK